MKKRLLLASVGIASGSLDTDKIDQVTGLKGKLNEKEAFLAGFWLTQSQFGTSGLNAVFCTLLPRKGKK